MRFLKWLTMFAMLCVIIGGIFMTGFAIQFFQTKKHVSSPSMRPAKHKIKVARWRKGKNDLLDYVIDQAQAAGVVVETATLNKSSQESMEVSFVLQASFDDVLNFVRLAVKNNIFLQIDSLDVITHSSRDEIRLSLTILNAQKIHLDGQSHLPEMSFHFSEKHFANLLASSEDDLSAVSVDAVKYIGYIKAGDKKSGLVLLPNGVTHFVTSGAKIGAGEVVQLDDSALTMKVRDKIILLSLK